MKVFLMYIGDILHCPPAMTVIQTLSDLDIQVVVCTNRFDFEKTSDIFTSRKNVTFKFLGEKYNPNISLLEKIREVPIYRKKIWNIIDNDYSEEDILWIIDGGNIKYFGKKLLKYKYILHLLELTEDIYYVESKHLLPISREYARKAACVVECEYNRAHITKTWWNLNELPVVLPNKPYTKTFISKKSKITNNTGIQSIIDNVKDKKVVLYQGYISKERPLKPFLDAVEELGDPFVFIAMVNGDDPFPDYKKNNYYHIPFVVPPFHLEVTSNAYIGVLTYTPIKNDYSILNTLYCAPNKIWEYSMFDVPVISNDLPALRYQFAVDKNGECFNEFDKEKIKQVILKIDNNYDEYSNAARKFFDSVDVSEIVQTIVNKAKKS